MPSGYPDVPQGADGSTRFDCVAGYGENSLMQTVDPWSRRGRLILVVILLVGGALRLADLRVSPPGLNQDEAVNAWDAYSMLKTGMDHHGQSWPIFYTRAFGGHSSTLYLYYLSPFIAVGGLNIWTVRFASAVGGILSLLLVYIVGKRLFGRRVGLVAAGLLAVNPWHLQQSRWAHEVAILPLLTVATLAAWLWAGFPLDDRESTPRAWRAAVAGALTAIACYGYAAIRVFLPLFFVAAVLVSCRAWWRMVQTREGRRAAAALGLAGGLLIAPLVWAHLAHPEGVSRRLEGVRAWNGDDAAIVKVAKVLARYPVHFDPRPLFFEGDVSYIQSPPSNGLFHPYMLPLMLIGLGTVACRVRRSRAARVLLAWVVLYPAGDMITRYGTIHALRSLPGVCGLVLLAAVGAVEAARWLQARRSRPAWTVAAAALALAIGLNVVYLRRFFVDFNRTRDVYLDYSTDLVEACEWLRPRFEGYDAVFCTSDGLNMPYMVTLVALGYDPQRWFREEREYVSIGSWEAYVRYGKMHFLYENLPTPALADLRGDGQPQKVLFIIRPNEVAGFRPVHVIRRPGGVESMWLCEATL